MGLRDSLAAWDGRTTSDLEQLYTTIASDSQFARDIVALIKDPATRIGASWLLKFHLAAGATLDGRIAASLFATMGRERKRLDWQTRLHLLQSLPALAINDSQKRRVESFLRICLIDENKFVRAWAYNGFHVLAVAHPEYADEVRQFLRLAMRDETGAVLARLRNIRKTGFDF